MPADHDSEAPTQTPLERAWSEYLAWTRGADPEQYEETERLAWRRLEDVRLEDLCKQLPYAQEG